MKGVNIMKTVEFVSYTGRWPSLCAGVLTLRIEGKEYVFGDYGDNSYDEFWSSGGQCYLTYRENITKGPWQVNKEELPKELQEHADEIRDVMNDNIPYGCCGGCI